MILLALSLTQAHADIPPPTDRRVQRYEVEFTGLDAHPDFALVVFPYSTSRGAPDAAAEVVEPGRPLELGGRIRGVPHVYAAPAATAAEVAATLTEAARSAPDALPDPAAFGLVSCGLDLTGHNEVVPLDAPAVQRHVVALTAVSASGCSLDAPDLSASAPAPAPAPAPVPVAPEGAAGCATVAGSAPWWALLLAAAAARRRQGTTVG